MVVRQTSLKAYKELNIQKREQEVIDALKQLGPSTNNEIARLLGWFPSSVSGRMNALRDKHGIVQEVQKRECNVTGNTAIEWWFT